MKLEMLFLIPEETHHQIMFICPTCDCQTFLPTTNELEQLHCCHCGDVHDARESQFEILTPAPQSADPGDSSLMIW